jgi:hypothetical protein
MTLTGTPTTEVFLVTPNFGASAPGGGQQGLTILDGRGDLTWFLPLAVGFSNLQVQAYQGQPVLTWWQGVIDPAGFGAGTGVIADSSYREVATVKAANGLAANLHELVLTPQGTALITAFAPTTADLRSVGGPASGAIYSGVAQEIDIATGKLVFEWRSIDHVPVDETHVTVGTGPLDYFHINSIDVTADGNLLVSARNTWAAYKVSRRTGRILWRLGGKRGDFTFGDGARFEWQHDVREHAGGLVSVFDNAAAPKEEPQSRALLLALDTMKMHVSLEHAYTHRPEQVLSHFLGNAQVLDNGDVFVGWGAAPYLTEFTRSGAIAFDARLPHGGQSYRAFRFAWVGHPVDRPALAARSGLLYASWNGATDYASWQLLQGASAADLQAALPVPRTGFETVLTPAPRSRSAAVLALDHKGAPIGRSATVAL